MHRLFHFFSRSDRGKEVVAVTWGVHSQDWMTALDASAPVWTAIPEVRVVMNLSPSRPERIPLKTKWGRRVVVIPLMEAHIAGRPRNYAALAPSWEALDLLGDKGRFADYVEKQALGHLCPATFGSIERASFPCVIKRTNLNGGQGVEPAASPAEARRILEGELFAGHPWIAQAVVPFDVEYVVHCVCVRGKIIWHVVYAYAFEKQHIRKAGSPHCTMSRATIPEAVLADLEKFLLPLAYSGPCNVDCTWDDAGRLVVFEINPRMGGSLMSPANRTDLADCLSVIIAEAE